MSEKQTAGEENQSSNKLRTQILLSAAGGPNQSWKAIEYCTKYCAVGQHEASLASPGKVHRRKGSWKGEKEEGGLKRRMQGGEEWLLATDTAGSWQRKPRWRPRSCCLLLSAAITAASAAAWPPQGLQPCNIHTHHRCTLPTHTSPFSCGGRHAVQEEGSDQSTAP